MNKISDVLARAWDLQRHTPNYSCYNIGEAYQQTKALHPDTRAALMSKSIRFYQSIALVAKNGEVHSEYHNENKPLFWNSARHEKHQAMRVEMLQLAYQSALRYEAYCGTET